MAINVTVEEGSGEAVAVEVNTGFVAHTHSFSDLVELGENIEDVVGFMLSENTESGISVTYDDETGKLNFDVNDPLITFSGDVSGSGTITDLGDTTFDITVLDNSHNHTASNISDFAEAAQDVVGGMLAGSQSGISVSYDDANGHLIFNVSDPVISISGDATGSATMTDLGNVDIEIDLSNTGVVAGSYGLADSVSQVIVDEDGRVTSAQDVSINILSTQVSDFTEATQDAAAPLLNHPGHTNITVTYDDENNQIVLVGSGNVLSVNGFTGEVVLDTDDIDEGTTNQYFTDDRAKDSAGDLISNATLTGLTTLYDPLTNSLTISNDGVLEVTGTEGSIEILDSGNGSFEIGFPEEASVPGNLTVGGNFTVLGEIVSIETTTLNVEDNNIYLNSGLTELDPPLLDSSGLFVNRGSQPMVSIAWDESTGNWIASDGTTGRIVGAVQTVNGQVGNVFLGTASVPETGPLYFTDERAINGVVSYLRDNASDSNITIDFTESVGDDGGSVDINIVSSPRVAVDVKNSTLTNILAGQLVYISGYSAGEIVPNVELADYNSETTTPAIGVADGDILSGGYGRVIIQGYIPITTREFDPVTETYSDLFFVGDVLCVGEAGGYVKYSDISFDRVIQKIAIVTRQGTDTVEGQAFIFNTANEQDFPVLEKDYFLLGEASGQSVPTKFSLENLLVDGYDVLPDPTLSQLGKIAYSSANTVLYYNKGGVWEELSITGHTHVPDDIVGLDEGVYNFIDSFISTQLSLGGLEYTYDPATNSGSLSVSDPEITLSVSGDLIGTATGQLNDLTNFSLDIPVAYDRALFGQYIFDSLDHDRHANITATFDATPEGSQYPQIILNAPTPYTQEEIQDFVAPLLNHSNHTNVVVTYDDLPNEILLSVPDSVDTIQFGTRTAVNGDVTVGLLDIASALGYTPIANNDAETVTDLIAPAIVHDNNVNIVATYDDDNDRIVLEAQNSGAASVGSLTNSWWLGA